MKTRRTCLLVLLALALLVVAGLVALGLLVGKARTLIVIGQVYHALGDYERTLAYFQQALALYQQAGDRRWEAVTLNLMGVVYGALSDYERALACFEQALPTFQEVGDREWEAITLNMIGAIYADQGDYEQALACQEQALLISREMGDRADEAIALTTIAGVYNGLSDYEQALAHYEQALSIFREIGNRNWEAMTLTGIGNVYTDLSDYEHALAYHEQALPISREIGDRLMEGTILANMGVVYHALSDYEQALAYLQQGLPVFRELGNRAREARTLNNMGLLYHDLKDYEEALAYYEQALPIQREIGDRAAEAATLNNMGMAYRELKDYEEALAYYQQALPIEREIGDPAGEAKTLSNIGVIYGQQSDYEHALAYYQQALAIHSEVGNRASQAVTLNNIGVVYHELTDYEQAGAYLHQALSVAQEIGDRAQEARTLKHIGRGHEEQGDHATALEFYLQSIAVGEAIRAGVRVETFQTDLAGREVRVYQRAVRLLVGMSRAEEAFNLSERNRARAFLDGLGNGRLDPRQTADADLLRREEALRGELTALESGLLAERAKLPGEQNEEIIRSVEAQLTTTQQEYQDLLALLQLANPELASLVTVPATTVTDTQALLDDQTTLVAFYLTDQNALAFVLSYDNFQVLELPASREEITEAVENFRSLGLANLGNAHPRSLRDLYTWLVAPLTPYLTTLRVGIIPHQTLHYIPFAALNDGERYFGQQFALFHLPSASVLPFIHDKVGREATTPLILGDPQTDSPDLPRLTHAAEEAEQVAELFGVGYLLGAEASEGTLRARVGEAGIVHLAAHGSFNAAAPLFSRLWLAPGGGEDGRLNVYEVYGLDLDQADLVVLSACQTQIGALSAGDDVVGLNRAFLYHAPTVVASLWSVDDEATGVLMARFYTHLLEGMGKAEALQAAQEEVRADAAHPEWAHPYYWAAFVLSGDPEEMAAR